MNSVRSMLHGSLLCLLLAGLVIYAGCDQISDFLDGLTQHI